LTRKKSDYVNICIIRSYKVYIMNKIGGDMNEKFHLIAIKLVHCSMFIKRGDVGESVHGHAVTPDGCQLPA
jgi:hypothetical protein